jgi:hypothetical protein
MGPASTHLVKPDVVSEVGVIIKLVVAAIGRTTAVSISSKDMNDPVLDFLCNRGQIHVVSAPGGAFYLEIVTVVLVKPLQTLNEQEVSSEPCGNSEPMRRIFFIERNPQIGPLQLELPPNIPDLESPGQ